MAGGPAIRSAPARMYLGATVYRIHGTNQPDTIGTRFGPAASAWSTPT